ncbi:MAG TPA: zinc ribbon domain-containing protein [Oculatellaceae cyanobacterium]
MSNCPYCDVLVDEAYNFCISCEQQVKCQVCGSYLIKDKSKCLKCGTSINTSQITATPLNNFSLEEEQSESNYSRKLNLSFTATAIDKVASVLSDYVPLTPSKKTKPVAQPQQQLALPFLQTPVENNPSTQSEITDEDIVETTGKNVSDNHSASDYFEKDGQGILISTTPDYKGKNKKLQQQRFSLLYVWAYNILYEEPVPSKEHLNQAAKKNGVYDTNYSTNLNHIANLSFIKSDDTFKLNPGGRSEVLKVLSEMQDSDLSGFEYWGKTRKNTNRGSRITKEDSQKIEEWVQMPSRFDSFDVRTLDTAYKCALLALYDITKELKIQDAVKPGVAYNYLIKRYKTISVTKENFSKALSNTKEYSKYFSRTSEGQYYLSPEAESLVEGWSNLNNEQNS